MDNLYIDIQRTLSYNALWNFILGMRGGGKTYGSLKYGIEQYLKAKSRKTKFQFLYVRRMKTELEKLTQMHGGRLFNAVSKEFPEHVLKAEDENYLLDKFIGLMK